jgi:hypothetical protein
MPLAILLQALPEKPTDGNFETFCNRGNFVIHEIAGLAFNPGDSRLIQNNSSCRQPPREIVLRNWRRAL